MWLPFRLVENLHLWIRKRATRTGVDGNLCIRWLQDDDFITFIEHGSEPKTIKKEEEVQESASELTVLIVASFSYGPFFTDVIEFYYEK